ncbi:MAG: hypothetical protein GEV13_04150 [Rhodospirillales bacterium]|nr:hypothetical protein [Rhodospirillales bacterium]
MAVKPNIFMSFRNIDARTFAAMTKAAGFGSAAVIQGIDDPTSDVSAESLAIVHAGDLWRMMETYLSDVGPAADEFLLKTYRPVRPMLPHEDIQFLVIDPSEDTVGRVSGGGVEARAFDVIRSVLPEGKVTKPTARDLLRSKSITALVKLIDQVDEQTALEALSAPDDLSALIWFLASPAAAGILAKSTHPLAASLMRGVERRRQLLAMEDGTASGQEFADALGISRQAVDKRRRAGDLLAIPTGSGDWRYPWWQLKEGKVLPGFEDVMAALGGLSPWACMDFFLSPDERLSGRRPLDALRKGDKGEVDFVMQSARAEGEQGAV